MMDMMDKSGIFFVSHAYLTQNINFEMGGSQF